MVGFSVAVWARLSAPSPDAGVIPERIARVAFGTEPQGPEAAVPQRQSEAAVGRRAIP